MAASQHGVSARPQAGPESELRPLPDLSTVMVTAGVGFAKRHPVTMGTWLVGLLLLAFATGHSVTQEQEAEYGRILSKIDYKRLEQAEGRVYMWHQRYYESKGFFSCDETCTANYEELQKAQAGLATVEQEFAALSSEAKQTVGLFSEYGVQEVRDLFWAQFAGGKNFAKQSSWYDLIFMSISSMGRDESLLEFAMRFMFQMLFNFTAGLVGALIGFYWYLWGVVSTYQPDFVLALLFFVLASVAATSFVATYLVGLYSAAAGSVYAVVKIGAAQGMRLEGGRRRGQQEFLRYQQQQQRRHAHHE